MMYIRICRSLADLRAQEGDESPSDNNATSSFSGGERSGLAIQNPNRDVPHASYAAAHIAYNGSLSVLPACPFFTEKAKVISSD